VADDGLWIGRDLEGSGCDSIGLQCFILEVLSETKKRLCIRCRCSSRGLNRAHLFTDTQTLSFSPLLQKLVAVRLIMTPPSPRNRALPAVQHKFPSWRKYILYIYIYPIYAYYNPHPHTKSKVKVSRDRPRWPKGFRVD